MKLKRSGSAAGRRARAAKRYLNASIEALEPRTMLNGLTVIVHGAELFSGLGDSDRPGWLDSMGQAVAARYGGNTPIYAVRVEPNGDNVKVTSFTRLSGAASSSASTSGETVLLLDWAKASNVNLFALSADYSATKIANAVIPYITTAFPAAGITSPLGEGTIQLIGHSRGGSVISELAKGLGAVGMWVDQVTFLDPRPVPPDPGISLKTNVIFADDYYQTSGDGLLTPNGIKVNGAYNVGPLTVDGGLGSTHDNITLFYQGTIDLSDNANIEGIRVPSTWYSGNSLNRGSIGFYFAHSGGGAWARPASGLSSQFGGSASRSALTRDTSVAQWANISNVNLSSYTIASGQSFAASFYYNSYNLNANLQWFLDPDRNPYNNNSIAVGAASVLGLTGDGAVLRGMNLVANAAKGSYFLEARISNAGGTRYAYSAPVSIVNASPTVSIDIAGPAAVQGWAVDTDTPAVAVSLRLDVDGIAVANLTANLSRPDLVKTFGSANHGFTYDFSGLADGIHKIDVFATDTTTGVTALAASRTITTNQNPVGSVDWFDGSILAGWAVDPDTSAASIQVRYQIDNNAPVIITADATRADLAPIYGSSNHGFALVLPQLSAGQHTITVHAIDPVSKSLVLLGQRTATVANPAGEMLPKGSVDAATTASVAGWAQDPSNPTASINVRVDVDGVQGTPFAANVVRADLAGPLGSANHGYSKALSLTPGAHRVDVYAIDPVTSVAVLLGSRIVGGAVPVGSLDMVTSSQIAGWAYTSAIAPDAAAAATVRIDIDGLAGVAFQTTLARGDINALYGAGTWGFSTSTPGMTTGSHKVSLVVIDPLTLAPTTIITRTLTI